MLIDITAGELYVPVMNNRSLIGQTSQGEKKAAVSRKERDRQLRRADILTAAEHLFALKGYHKATIRDIAHEAQYAVGTVYLYFKDKDTIYFALFEEKLKRLLSGILQQETEQTRDAKNKLKVFVENSLAFFEGSQDFFRIFSSGEDSLLIETKILKTSAGRQLQEYVERLVVQAQEESLISSTLDPGQVRDVFFAVFKIVVRGWFNGEHEADRRLVDLSDTILGYFLNGAAHP